MKRWTATLTILFIISSLTGCGQMGPLTLPNKQAPISTQQTKE